MAQVRDNELKEFGISRMQVRVLFAARHLNEDVTPAAIARWLFRRPHTISGIVDRMVLKGLVEKQIHYEKRNWITIKLTDHGEDIFRQAHDNDAISKIFASLSHKKRKALMESLDTLRSFAEVPSKSV